MSRGLNNIIHGRLRSHLWIVFDILWNYSDFEPILFNVPLFWFPRILGAAIVEFPKFQFVLGNSLSLLALSLVLSLRPSLSQYSHHYPFVSRFLPLFLCFLKSLWKHHANVIYCSTFILLTATLSQHLRCIVPFVFLQNVYFTNLHLLCLF